MLPPKIVFTECIRRFIFMHPHLYKYVQTNKQTDVLYLPDRELSSGPGKYLFYWYKKMYSYFVLFCFGIFIFFGDYLFYFLIVFLFSFFLLISGSNPVPSYNYHPLNCSYSPPCPNRLGHILSKIILVTLLHDQLKWSHLQYI